MFGYQTLSWFSFPHSPSIFLDLEPCFPPKSMRTSPLSSPFSPLLPILQLDILPVPCSYFSSYTPPSLLTTLNMGCIPSTAAYPGNKRTAMPSYQPGANEFEQVNSNTAVCTTHFVTCAGGNALKLVGKPNRADANIGGGDGPSKYIQGKFICSSG